MKNFVWLVALPLSFVSLGARADETIRYTVQPGDTCASIAQRFYGDARLVEPIHGANAMTTPPPHGLTPGRVLVIPPRPANVPHGPDAKLSAVRNRVEVKAPEPRPGKVDDPLFRGNRVTTDVVSSAAVTFRDETQVRLGERTLVVILGDARGAAAKTTSETSLVTGSLRAWMASPSSRTQVKTEGADVRVIEGEAKVSSDTKKTTRLAVYNGNSTVTAVHTRREVPAGFGSKADLGGAPTVPKPLPPAPVWTSTSPTLLVDRGDGAPAFSTSFAAPAGSAAKIASWHVQVARDATFFDIVTDETIPENTKRLEARPQGTGRYFARVSAVDDDHFEGPWARPLSFGIARIARTQEGHALRVSFEPKDLFCVRVGNVALQRIGGELAVSPREPLLIRCGLSELEPTTLID